MTSSPNTDRLRPGTVLRTTLTGVSAAVLALTLTACDGDGASTGSHTSGAAASRTSGAATAQPSGGGAGAAAPTAGAEPAGKSTTGTSPSAAATASATPVPAAPAASAGTDSGCDHKMPISPDEIAVYRYTPEGGSLSLIVKHGTWGCAPADSDGAPFETVGKETYIPMDQAAYVTVTNPIVESTENQRIGVQEFLDWLEAHPDSGLVFRYHLGADGAIDRLEEEFTP